MPEHGQNIMTSEPAPPTPAPPAAASSPRRPVEVTILAGLLIAQGLLFLLVESALAISDIARHALADALTPDDLALARTAAAITALVFALIGTGLIVLGLATLRLMGWAHIVVQLGEALYLAGELVAFSRGEANYPEMALAVAIVWYLNRRPVQEAFARRRAAPAVEGTVNG